MRDDTQSEVHAGSAEATSLTTAEWLYRWLAEETTGVSPKTREGYSRIVEQHLAPAFGDVPLAELDAAAINRFYREQEKTYSARTVLHHHRCLHRALRSAVEAGLLDSSPITAAVVLPKPHDAAERQWLDDDGIRALLDSVRGDRALEVPVALAVLEGLRVGEICGLRWSDVDLSGGLISVRRSIEWTREGGLRERPPTSKRGQRDVPLRRRAAEILERWQPDDPRPQSPVVPAPDGTATSPNAISSRWASWSARAENAGSFGAVRFEDLRHSCAAWWLARDFSILKVSRWLGHSSIDFTADVYGHLMPEARDLERMNELDAQATRAG